MNDNKIAVDMAVAGDAALTFFEALVKEHGLFAVEEEAKTIDGKTIAVATVGMTDKGWPEMIVVGLPADIAGQVLTAVSKLAEPPKIGEEIVGLTSLKMRAESISDAANEKFLSAARTYRLAHGGYEVEGIQLVLADEDGRWPQDAEANPEMRKCQLLLADYRN